MHAADHQYDVEFGGSSEDLSHEKDFQRAARETDGIRVYHENYVGQPQMDSQEG